MKLLTPVIQRARLSNLPALVSTGVAVLGVLCLLAGFRSAWFELPWPSAAEVHDGQAAMHGIEASCTLPWKIALALALAASAIMAWKFPAKWRSIVCVGLSAIIAALLFYPCSLLYFAPVEASRANWLQIQHRNINTLGGDISASSEVQNRDWNIHITVVDLPRQVGAVQIPKSIPSLLELGRVGDAVEWLGYSDAFCTFAGRGWLFAVIGSALLLAGTARGVKNLDRPRARLALSAFGATAGVLLLLAATPVLVTGFAVGRAHAAIQAGDYAASGRWLNTAGTAMPVIRENSYFIIQQGLIDTRLGRPTLEAAHYQAICLENGEFYSQAEASCRELLGRVPANSAIQRETLRDLLRMAVRNIKGGELQRGIPLMELVLHFDPANLKANYCLQTAYLHLDRLDDLEKMIASMRQIYAFMGTVTKLPALAACLDNEAFLRYHRGDTEGALLARRASP